MVASKDNVEKLINQPQALAPQAATPIAQSASAFSSMAAFEGVQRMAKLLCASSLIPDDYKGNLPNTVIALEMANRIGASALAVMQNLYIVHGKPGWSSQFIIASLNSCGRYSPLRFQFSGEGDNHQCFAWCYDLNNNNERIEGPTVTIGMAKSEGWYGKKGSKWPNMPDIMLTYRAASFFGKLYAPEILMGMQSSEELHDIIDLSPNTGDFEADPAKGATGVKDKLKTNVQFTEAEIVESETIVDGVDTTTGEVVKPSANDRLKQTLKGKAKPTNADEDLF